MWGQSLLCSHERWDCVTRSQYWTFFASFWESYDRRAGGEKSVKMFECQISRQVKITTAVYSVRLPGIVELIIIRQSITYNMCVQTRLLFRSLTDKQTWLTVNSETGPTMKSYCVSRCQYWDISDTLPVSGSFLTSWDWAVSVTQVLL